MKLSIIIVHYGPTTALERCLNALTAPGGPNREIIVVDNGGDTPLETKPKSGYTIVTNSGNLGYAHGCNTGVSRASGELLLFLNEDAVAMADDLNILVNEYTAHPEYSILSCRQTNSQGRQSKTFDSFPSPATLFGLSRALIRMFSPGKNPNPHSNWDGIIDCDWVTGSVVMISVADLEKVGGWSNDYWLYGEDWDLCRRAGNRGMRVGCTSAVTLVHDHGVSTRSDENIEAICRAETTISGHAWAARHLTGISSTIFHWLQIIRSIAGLLPIAIIDLLTFSRIRSLRTRRSIFVHLLRYYRSAPWERTWTSPRAPSQMEDINLHPIQFSIPTNRILDEVPDKEHCFSYISPGITKYSFNSESEYYRHYGGCYFAITVKKGGWDCLRHYEILGSGCIPYFINLEHCPPATMFKLPKDLLLKARSLPGMPSYEEVLDHADRDNLGSLEFNWSEFSKDEYNTLLNKLTSYTRKHLTTKSIAEYVLSKLPYDVKKVLFISDPHKSIKLDYQRDLLLIGLTEAGVDIYSTSDLFWLYDDASEEVIRKTYGRGFTVTMNIPSKKRKTFRKNEIFDAIIMCTSSNRGFNQSWKTCLSGYDKEKIIWVDGSDIRKTSHYIPSACGFAFKREMEGVIECL